jgi:hypothetical protein
MVQQGIIYGEKGREKILVSILQREPQRSSYLCPRIVFLKLSRLGENKGMEDALDHITASMCSAFVLDILLPSACSCSTAESGACQVREIEHILSYYVQFVRHNHTTPPNVLGLEAMTVSIATRSW